jgi:hypothetical protein
VTDTKLTMKKARKISKRRSKIERRIVEGIVEGRERERGEGEKGR